MTEYSRSTKGRHKARNKQSNNKQNNKSNNKYQWIKRIILLAILGTLLFLLLGIGLFAYYASNAPAFNADKLKDPMPTKIYDKNDQLVTTLYTGNKREKVTYENVPSHVKDAVLATEDDRYFEHGAIDFRRLFGAVFSNVTDGFGSQGASTITQQVVKRTFLTDKKSIERKAQEAYLAYRLEQEYSKEDIFEMYINKIYYSDGVYGIRTASKYYFNKELKDLSLAESAYLAGLPQIPNRYNIYDHPESAEKRKDIVLHLMHKHDRITEKEMKQAQQDDLTQNLVSRKDEERTLENPADDVYNAYVDVIRKEISQHDEFKGMEVNEALAQGLSIYTNMDNSVQQRLIELSNNTSFYSNPKYNSQDFRLGATILDTNTGGLVAITGGRNYERVVDTNEALQKHFVGSTIKPILNYGPAIEYLNWPTNHKVEDEKEYKIEGSDKTISNYDGEGHGEVTIREALKVSYNIPAVKAFEAVREKEGLDGIIDFASKSGVNYDQNYTKDAKNITISDALGGHISKFSTAEIAESFATFGNGGQYNEMSAIRYISNPQNEEIKFEQDSHKAMKDSTAFMITDMLKDVITPTGSAYRAHMPNLNVAAKTGTQGIPDEQVETNPNLDVGAASDVWISGYTPHYTMSVWMGFDTSEKGRINETAFIGHDEQLTPQYFFKEIMQNITPNDNKDFEKPDSVVEIGNGEYAVKDSEIFDSIMKDKKEKSLEEAKANKQKAEEEKKKAEEAKQKAEEEKKKADAKQKAEEEKKKADAKQKAEEEKKKADAKKKAEEEKKKAEEEKKKAEEEKKKAEEAKQKAEEERKKAEEEAKKKAEEERKKAEEEAKKKAEEERKKAEEEAKKKAEEEQKKAEQEAEQQAKEQEAKRKAQEEADKARQKEQEAKERARSTENTEEAS
ncbi:transglycosylase domain-containing protein [Abyssicoccus albus]|uniref:Penicillin-binding protein 1A n=1 Tax=Abyssicoccus albus TaxID=1817405 RepID=A0A3N5BJG9_9BACL|nr:transglycosylase domain-containing protein [Abyssicoccus albus]RPF58006.1 penicillin-binding protein 1A [Abyssicoccus albus]